MPPPAFMRHGKGPGGVIAVYAAAVLAAAGVHAESDYAWMSENFEDNVSLIYGSPESGEDILFFIYCNNRDRHSELTVYEEIEGAEAGQPLMIEIGAGAAKVSIEGRTATDEMNGYIYGMAEKFPVRPLLGVLKGDGPVTVKMGAATATLPEAGRADAVSAFDGDCKLD